MIARQGNVSARWLRLLAAVLIAFPASTWAEPTGSAATELARRLGKGDPAAGKIKSQSENCQECHGAEGVSTVVSVPKLAGQYSEYIVKQLRDFKFGARRHPVMNAMAEGLTEDDRLDIAAYFASRKTMQEAGMAKSQAASDIFNRGDQRRNVPQCKSCHGESGGGRYSLAESGPVIGGQHKIYLREQLFNWRSGARTNSTGGVMNIIASSLSDAEIEALSNYISGL